MSNYTIVNRRKLNNILDNNDEQDSYSLDSQKETTSQLVNHIKLLIKKVITIENTINELESSKNQVGGQSSQNGMHLKKYKKEILKLREQRKLYLMELEMYKQKIQEMAVQNQFFSQKISQLSFSNYINSSEKNNLIDKLDFFNKSLDILTGSILTNVNAGNQLLEKVSTNTNITKENKVSNVNVTIQAEDMFRHDGVRINLEGGDKKLDNMESLQNSVLSDSAGIRSAITSRNPEKQLVSTTNSQLVGGFDIGKFQRENKISQISNELKSKISLMSTITGGVRRIIENIVRIINDQGNPNSLLNIRIKFEAIINKFKEVSEENEEAKKLITILEDVRDGIGSNITDISAFENLLKKVETDTKGFVTGVEDISKGMSYASTLDNIVESRKADNEVQSGSMKGGNQRTTDNFRLLMQRNENDIDNLLKLLNIVQRGGLNSRPYFDYTTIDGWLTFFSNSRNWVDASKYKFNTVRTNYYMIKEVNKQIVSTYDSIDATLNPLNELMSIIDKNNFSFKYFENENVTEVFNEEFNLKNTSEGIEEVKTELEKEFPLDVDRFLLGFLLDNNSDNANAEVLDLYVKRITNINNNLTELLYSFNFFKGLSYTFSLTEKDITADKVVESQQILSSLQKLAYQTNLYMDQADFITHKAELLQVAYTKLYWIPFETFLNIYNYLDKKLQADIDIIETNIKNFILGMKYSSNQSQVHSLFYSIDLHNEESSSLPTTLSITKYQTTFLYINMLKKALYGPGEKNGKFRDLISAFVSSKIKTLDIVITRETILSLSGTEIVPELNNQAGGSIFPQVGGSGKDELKVALGAVCDLLRKEIDKNVDLIGKNLKEQAIDESKKETMGEKISAYEKIISSLGPIRQVVDDIPADEEDKKTRYSEISAYKETISNLIKEESDTKIIQHLELLLSLFKYIIKATSGEVFDESGITDEDQGVITAGLDSDKKANINTALCKVKDIMKDTNEEGFKKLLLTIYKQKLEHAREGLSVEPIVPEAEADEEQKDEEQKAKEQKAEEVTPTVEEVKPVDDGTSTANTGKPDVVTVLITDATTNFTNANRSKITDIYSMIDKFVDGLKIDSFEKIRDNLNKYMTEVNSRRTAGAFNNKTISPKTFTANVKKAITRRNRLENQKQQIKLILENIDKKQGQGFIEEYVRAINAKLEEISNGINGIGTSNKGSLVAIAELREEVMGLYNKMQETEDESEKQNIKAKKRELAKKYREIYKTFDKTSKQQVELVNQKGYALDFQEFINTQQKNYEDAEEGNKLMEGIINLLEKVKTSQFETDKVELKKGIRELIVTSDTDPDYLRRYEIIKKLNIQIVYTIDKIISESLNAIAVFVKARKEGTEESNRYSFDSTCVTVKGKDGMDNLYGQFRNIFWSDRTIADLYCGKDIKCDDKVPLTNSVRDIIQKESTSNNFITYGASGSGKTTLLFGRADSSIEGDREGIITKIIKDVLGGAEIPNSGKELMIECMIGEVYGEKMNLSLLDNKYIECLYVWDIKSSNPTEKLYIHDFGTETSEDDYQNFNKKLQYLEELKNTQYRGNRKFDISVLDKARIWRSTHPMQNKFENDNLKTYLNLDGYTKSQGQLTTYDEYYRLDGSTGEDPRTLYNILTDEDSYKKYSSGVIYDPKKIAEFGKTLSQELEGKIEKIQNERKLKNRVRCTKYNPESSRSHMYIIVRIVDEVTGKFRYFCFIDKAGSEIPYEIAAGEFVRLAEDPKPEGVSFFNVRYNLDEVKGDDFKDETKNISGIYEKLKQRVMKEIQIIEPGDFIAKSSVAYDAKDYPTITLAFSENFKIEIETKYTNVVSVVSDTQKLPDGSSKTSIKIKALRILFNVKIYNSGVVREFSSMEEDWDSSKQLQLNLDYLVKLIKSKGADDTLVRDIILNVKSSIIKKNMPQLLFSGSSSTESPEFNELTTSIGKNISDLTDNLMNVLDLFAKNTEIPANTKLPAGYKELFAGYVSKNSYLKKKEGDGVEFADDNQEQNLFLNFSLSNLTSIPDIKDIKVELEAEAEGKVEFTVVRACRTSPADFETNFYVNIKHLHSQLEHLLQSDIGKKNYSTKISLLLNSIKELYEMTDKTSIADDKFTTDVLGKIKNTEDNAEFEKLMGFIEEATEIMKKAYLYVSLNKKITEHTSTNDLRTETFNKIKEKVEAVGAKFDDVLPIVNGIKNTYEEDFIKSLFEMVIEKSYSSAVDKTLPTTEKLGIDYRNLLASYYIQRGYFAKLKPGSKACNSQEIINVLTRITETIRFVFDDVAKNTITKAFIDKEFLTSEIGEGYTTVTLDRKKLFDSDPKIKTDVTKWQGHSGDSRPETLADLSPFLDDLEIDYSSFDAITELKLKNDKDTFEYYFTTKEGTDADAGTLTRNLNNLFKRLYLISKLNDNFRFLDCITFTDNNPKIIDVKSLNSIVSNYDNILWKDNDRITYMLEYEQLFNFQILFDLYNINPDSLKYKELSKAKNVWTNDECQHYGSTWSDVANKIIPIFLLNVRQGFWINHSIRYLMRNIMYTSDNIWIDNPIFDVSPAVRADSIGQLDAVGKQDTSNLLTKNIMSLEDYTAGESRNQLSNKIFSNEKTLEEVYMAPFDIKRSPWLKLLGTLHQLGSNNHPTEIRIKVPKRSESGSNQEKWGEALIKNFIKLNFKLFLSDGTTTSTDTDERKKNAEKFIKEINTNSEFPPNFSFKDRSFSGIVQAKYSKFLDASTNVGDLRLPWTVAFSEADGSIVKSAMKKCTEFKNLFEYNVDGKEVTVDEIKELNQIYKAHNELLGTKPGSVELAVTKIGEYRKKVSTFKDAVKKSDIDAIKPIFSFGEGTPTMAGGYNSVVTQYGGEPFTAEEKAKIEELVVSSKTASKDDKSFVELVNYVINNIDDKDKISYLLSPKGVLTIGFKNMNADSHKTNISKGWTTLFTDLSNKINLGISEINSNLSEATTVINVASTVDEALENISTFNQYKNTYENYDLVAKFFESVLVVTKQYFYISEANKKLIDIAIESKDNMKNSLADIKVIIDDKEIYDKICKLYFDDFFKKLKQLGISLNSFNKNESTDDIAIEELRDEVSGQIDKEVVNMTNVQNLYVNSTNDKDSNRNTAIKNIIEYNLLLIDLDTEYMKKIIGLITIDDDDQTKTFESFEKYWKTVETIHKRILEMVEKQSKSSVGLEVSEEKKSSITAQIQEKLDIANEIFTHNKEKQEKYFKIESERISKNTGIIDKFITKFNEEMKVKNELGVTYNEALAYDEQYNSKVDELAGKFKPGDVKESFKVTLSSITSTSIEETAIIEKDKPENFSEAIEVITGLVKEYVNTNGIYPCATDVDLFQSFLQSSYQGVKSKLFHKISKGENKKIISKKSLNKSKIYEDALKLRSLIDNDEPLEVQVGGATPDEIAIAKTAFYSKYFNSSDADSQVDVLVNNLSNAIYIEDFSDKREEPYYTLTEVTDGDKNTIIDVITKAIVSGTISKEKDVVDPLAGIDSLDKVSIEDLKISKQVQSITVSNPDFKISSSRTLLLALSTRPDKVELVMNTLAFARLLSQITNPPCKLKKVGQEEEVELPEEEVDLQGEGIPQGDQEEKKEEGEEEKEGENQIGQGGGAYKSKKYIIVKNKSANKKNIKILKMPVLFDELTGGNFSEPSFLRISTGFDQLTPIESHRSLVISSELHSGGFRRDWSDKHLPNPGVQKQIIIKKYKINNSNKM